MTTLASAALVLGALTLAACGSAGGPVSQFAAAPPHIASPAAPTPMPTPTPDVIAAAGQAYLAHVAALDAVYAKVDAEEQAIPLTAAFTSLVPPERERLAALQTWHAFTTSYAWPASVQTHVSALVAAEQTEIVAIQNFIDSPAPDTWDSLISTNQAASRAAAELRLALYLPQLNG